MANSAITTITGMVQSYYKEARANWEKSDTKTQAELIKHLSDAHRAGMEDMSSAFKQFRSDNGFTVKTDDKQDTFTYNGDDKTGLYKVNPELIKKYKAETAINDFKTYQTNAMELMKKGLENRAKNRLTPIKIDVPTDEKTETKTEAEEKTEATGESGAADTSGEK